MARKSWYLKEWRLDRGLTLEELAAQVTELTEDWGDRAVRVSKSDVSKLELEKRRYNSDQLKAFAEVLKCTQGELVDFTPQEAKEIRRLVSAIVKRGRTADLRLLRTMAEEDPTAV